MCLSQQNASGSKPTCKKKAALSKNRRASTSASSKSSANVTLPYGVEDFPMIDITEAPQVRKVAIEANVPVYMCICVIHTSGDDLYQFCLLAPLEDSYHHTIADGYMCINSCSYTSQVIVSILDQSTSLETWNTVLPHPQIIKIMTNLPLLPHLQAPLDITHRL